MLLEHGDVELSSRIHGGIHNEYERRKYHVTVLREHPIIFQLREFILILMSGTALG